MPSDVTTPTPKLRPETPTYQPLSLVFAAAVLGILIDRLITPPAVLWGVAALFALFLAAVLHLRARPVAASLLGLLACGSLFGFWHHDRWNRFEPNDLGFYAREIGTPVALQGVVRDMPKVLPVPPLDPGRVFEVAERTILTLQAKKLRDGDRWIDVTGKASLVVEGERDDLRVGDTIQLFGSLARPTGPQNPGDFDYAAMLRGKRILCVVRCSSPEAVTRLRSAGSGVVGVAGLLEDIRRRCRRNLEDKMPARTAPLATAMLLGMREGVDEETTQSLMETGTLHILAISGLHIGIVAAMIGFGLYILGVSRRRSALILVAAVLLYLFLTDVRPPAIRATVLVCVVSTAWYTGRRSYGVNTLCATALIVLILNPTELFQFGAQLSFIATGAFFWVPSAGKLKSLVYRSENEEQARRFELRAVERVESRQWPVVQAGKRCLVGAVQLFLVSLTIWAVSMPLLLERIHLFTPIALLVNPLLWLPLSAALAAGFATMLFGGVPYLGTACGYGADRAFEALFGMIDFFHRQGGYYWVPGPATWWNLVFYTGFVVLTFLPLRRPRPRTLAAVLAGWILIGLLVAGVRDLDRRWNDRLTLTVFSVGHGNCVLVVTPEKKTIVYDVGCISSPRRAADILARGLWRLGKTRIDAIVVSHADNDHYNGVVHLVKRFSIGAVYISPYMFEKPDPSTELFRDTLREHAVPLIEIADGDRLPETLLSETVFFHPPKSDFGENDSSNAASLVLRLEHRGIGVLLPGDLDGRLTPAFLEREPVPCDILMLPHHGGRSRQTEPLLQWAEPKLLLVSAGRFTHRDEVLAAFRERGYRVRSTFQEGCIEISIDRHSDFHAAPEDGKIR